MLGVDDPTPIKPLARILKNDVPVEEATLKASLVPAFPCTLNVTVEEVAFTPATVPLSRNSPVESAEADVHLAKNPLTPVESAICGDVVAITWPCRLVARNEPVIPVKDKLVVPNDVLVPLVISRLVAPRLELNRFVDVPCVKERIVPVALVNENAVVVACLNTPLVEKKLVEEAVVVTRTVPVAFVNDRAVVVALVEKRLVNEPCVENREVPVAEVNPKEVAVALFKTTPPLKVFKPEKMLIVEVENPVEITPVELLKIIGYVAENIPQIVDVATDPVRPSVEVATHTFFPPLVCSMFPVVIVVEAS